ncbi:MAG TPA: type II/IV secretion system protein [Nitrospirae bacterium]|nr:type II secretion system protein E [bacterium BMS3Abin09]GBE41217.1 type II secretion system protein E [bacterium BMS3Bbin09]HDH33889.1 type II/IV secretion system protein [Nitrospirota bacterium]HDO67126.1 type II/IV secretion system protein [Nitrospirota bacterium]HDZ84027.1 type II/IV secretion system protein [Nitrospirota bacterium]
MDKENKKTILNILTSSGLLSKEQSDEVLSKENLIRSRIIKSNELKGQVVRRGRAVHADISIIDVISLMNLPVDGKSNTYVTEEVVMKEIAGHLGIKFIKIDPLKLDSDVITKIISRPYALKHKLLPIALSGNHLTIATSNPFEHESIDRISQSKGYDIEVVVSNKSDIVKIVTEFYGFRSSIAAAEDELASNVDIGNLEQFVKLKSISELADTDQHIINAVEYLLHYAYSQRASDIHIEPKREHCLVRFRIDGLLHNIHKMPKAVYPAFASRIKTLSRMDIAEKRRPQGGRIKTSQDGKEIELRVSTLPVSFGEKIVIRIFDPTILMQNINDLGFSKREGELFGDFLSAPNGLILVTGPTGSGKTTTLYSALKTLSTEDVNLTTIEDPVEMICEDFNQTSIQPQIGITFASSLRTILRQDPDIIMVGEIRDLETADNAIQSALTGHLVMSTLHTNDAPGTITRLLDLGIAPFLINASLIGVVAQRLVRKVCSNCAEEYTLSEGECRMLGLNYDEDKKNNVNIGTGCNQCRGTGYFGRTGVFEVMEISDTIKAEIESKSSPEKIRQVAKNEGYTMLKENAVKVLLEGRTTVDEIVRVIGV